jgi:hypothetical protein
MQETEREEEREREKVSEREREKEGGNRHWLTKKHEVHRLIFCEVGSQTTDIDQWEIMAMRERKTAWQRL